MANFNTHLFVASIGSGSAAVVAINTQLINWVDAPWLILMGTIGGLLPDIDSDNSKQVKWLFSLLAIICVSVFLSSDTLLQGLPALIPSNELICHAAALDLPSFLGVLSKQCIPTSLIFIALAIFIIIRYMVFNIFQSLTVHRGVFHSILAAVFFSLLTTYISYSFLKQGVLFAWMSGFFVGIGFILHLLLDEMYSVDLTNVKIKRSFGTALKLCSYKSAFASLSMLLCTAVLYDKAPPKESFLTALYASKQTIHQLVASFESKDLNYTGGIGK